MPPMGKERDWKVYEPKLLAKKRLLVEFFVRAPTGVELERELTLMNQGKRGRKFEIPRSVMCYFHFFKHCFGTDDRMLAIQLSKFMGVIGIVKEFDHSTIVKRRDTLEFEIPEGITPERLRGKRLYFDGMCLRVGRGGYYRSKKYLTEVKYLRVGVFTDDQGNVVDFVIGDEHDAEINMIREKLSEIIKSKPRSMTIDGAGAAIDVVARLSLNGIKPIIRASKPVVKLYANKPPPCDRYRQDRVDQRIWENYAKEQKDYQKWRKQTDYSMRWVHSEGYISGFKRMLGEQTTCRTQKALHDEIAAKFMLKDAQLPKLWE